MEGLVDSSGLAAMNSLDQEDTSSALVATESYPVEWTDEKHRLFLESMEAAFVNQLYQSLAVLGSKSPTHKEISISSSSGEFKALPCDGCWSKLDSGIDEREVDQEEESEVPFAESAINYSRRSKRKAIPRFRASSQTKAPLATKNGYPSQSFQLQSQDSVGDNTEVTGQNFNDENLDQEKTRRISSTKRRRTSTDIASCEDQVTGSCLKTF